MYSDLTEYSLFSWILCWPGTFFKQYWKMLIQWNQIFYGHIVSPVFGWECFQILREIWGGGEIQPFPEIIHWPRHPAWLWVRCSEPHGHLHCLTAGGEPVNLFSVSRIVSVHPHATVSTKLQQKRAFSITFIKQTILNRWSFINIF